jgi:hypothetical protein
LPSAFTDQQRSRVSAGKPSDPDIGRLRSTGDLDPRSFRILSSWPPCFLTSSASPPLRPHNVHSFRASLPGPTRELLQIFLIGPEVVLYMFCLWSTKGRRRRKWKSAVEAWGLRRSCGGFRDLKGRREDQGKRRPHESITSYILKLETRSTSELSQLNLNFPKSVTRTAVEELSLALVILQNSASGLRSRLLVYVQRTAQYRGARAASRYR